MKRTKTSSRAMRHQNNASKGITRGNSHYSQKVQRRDQMFGPGCCAHGVSVDDVNKMKDRALARRKNNPYWTLCDGNA